MHVKTQILAKLQEVEDLLIKQATISNKTFDLAELEDADVENQFEHIRGQLRAVGEDVLEIID